MAQLKLPAARPVDELNSCRSGRVAAVRLRRIHNVRMRFRFIVVRSLTPQ